MLNHTISTVYDYNVLPSTGGYVNFELEVGKSWALRESSLFENTLGLFRKNLLSRTSNAWE